VLVGVVETLAAAVVVVVVAVRWPALAGMAGLGLS
jgi:hypothetical protein